jgi:uncharacterized membrane protein
MSPLLLTLTTLAALGCAVLAGVFVAFSTLVMNALGRLPAAQGISAMQAINRAALTPVFMVLFLGTTLLCGALSVWSFFVWGSGGAPLLLAGGLAYLVGAFGLTVGYHVPRNNALDALDPAAAEALTHWNGYLRGWTRWNHVRGAASVAAAALFIVALVLG